jgi:hypothetical protein
MEKVTVELVSVPTNSACRRFVDPDRLEIGLMACGFVRDSKHRKEFVVDGENIYRDGKLVAYLERKPMPVYAV